MKNKRVQVQKKHRRVRKKVVGSAARPRLAVYRSLKHISGQLIDDDRGQTLVYVSSQAKEFSGDKAQTGNKDAAKAVGKVIAEKAKAAGISKVVFDRGGNVYHGRIQALAEGAREGGLEF